MKYGLSEKDLSAIIQAASSFDAIDRVILFGSRAKGNYRPTSDIDLAIYGDQVNFHIVSKLHARLEDLSHMPYLFDIVDGTHLTHQALKRHIERVGQVIFKKSSTS
ncbi:DNA polymerase III subunit beta [Bacillus sp. AFS077874]|uniref:nucleotidyltransferase family protein n=1 Tax=Bacillus sp. AFS077874 TaxID=2033513 RepID=UPI000BFA793F|nr:nucleotidyltransferase domain-containing protein [Bacillus sp. AFS077874]PFM75222.1 DNA polymerase III subunit beta [Bacillus sp. AFS077874]